MVCFNYRLRSNLLPHFLVASCGSFLPLFRGSKLSSSLLHSVHRRMGEAMFRMSSVQTGVAREVSGLKACRCVSPHTVAGSKIRRYNQLRWVVEISLLQGLGYIQTVVGLGISEPSTVWKYIWGKQVWYKEGFWFRVRCWGMFIYVYIDIVAF